MKNNNNLPNSWHDVESAAAIYFNGIQTPHNTMGVDVIGSDPETGKTVKVECKDLRYNRPHIGGKYVLKDQTCLYIALFDYCKADRYFIATRQGIQVFGRDDFISFALKRVVVEPVHESRKGKDGKTYYTLRLGKTPRTEKQDEKLKEYGFTVY